MSPSTSYPSTPVASRPSSPTGLKSVKSAVWSSLKKPFQGWSKELLAAKVDLDDEYNFTDCRRRGFYYGHSEEERRSCDEDNEKAKATYAEETGR
jgi:hypothetical protein